LSAFTDLAAPLKAHHTLEKDMKNIGLKETDDAVPEADTGLLVGWLDRADLARELTLSVDTLQRWETRRMGPPCVRVGRKVIYRMEAVRDWLREQEARKALTSRAVAARR
jgi:hypothetical protein